MGRAYLSAMDMPQPNSNENQNFWSQEGRQEWQSYSGKYQI
jgi:hypothetical protein